MYQLPSSDASDASDGSPFGHPINQGPIDLSSYQLPSPNSSVLDHPTHQGSIDFSCLSIPGSTRPSTPLTNATHNVDPPHIIRKRIRAWRANVQCVLDDYLSNQTHPPSGAFRPERLLRIGGELVASSCGHLLSWRNLCP